MKKDKSTEQLKNMSLVLEIKSIDKKNRIIRGVVGTTGNLDRHGDTVNPEGWVLENFLKNPVIFVNHASWELPVGKAVEVRRVENGLEFDIQFSKTLPKAEEVWGLVEEGIMKAWSVGFIVLDWGGPGDGYTIMKQELLELSIVGLPANPDAMSPEKSKALSALNKFIEEHGEKKKHIDEEDVVVPTEEETPEAPTSEEEGEKTPKTPESGESEKSDVEKRLEALENEVEELKKFKQETTKNISDFMNKFESDENISELDSAILALKDAQSELRSDNKQSGKALKNLNKVLNIIEGK